jgi:hypothetical protein
MTKNQKVVVAHAAPFHKGFVGYFQFLSEDGKTAVISRGLDLGQEPLELIAVHVMYMLEALSAPPVT